MRLAPVVLFTGILAMPTLAIAQENASPGSTSNPGDSSGSSGSGGLGSGSSGSGGGAAGPLNNTSPQ